MDLEDKVEKMYADFYVGDGKKNPSITARMALVEDTVERIGSNLGKMVWLLVGIFVTIIGDIVIHSLKFGGG